MASEQATVPSDIFVSDLYKSSVDYKEEGGMGHSLADLASSSKASMAPEPEATDIEQEEPTPDDLPDWSFLYLQHLVDRTLPLDPAKPHDWLAAPRILSSSTARCTNVAPRASSCGASPIRRARISSRKFTWGLQPSRNASNTGRKCLSIGFLLAYCHGRCHRDCPDM